MIIPPALADLPRRRRPAILNAADYWLRLDQFLTGCGGLGDRFLLTFPGTGAWLALTDPADIEQVFRAEGSAMHLAEALRMLSPHELVLGPKVLTSLDGEEHLTKRRELLPLFHGDALKSYEAVIANKARAAVASWPTAVEVEALVMARDVTLEVIMAVVFGVTDDARLGRLRAAIIDLSVETAGTRFLIQMAAANLRNDGFGRPFPRIEARKAAVDAVIIEEIAARAATGDPPRPDMLGRLLAASPAAGDAEVDHQQVCDQLRLMLIGGHETTAATIAWTLERIAHTPRIIPELQRTVRDGDDTFLDAVIHETLRLKPVFPFTVRLTKRPLELDGLTVPTGTLVAPIIHLVHRRPDIYPEPHVFRPERFLGVRPGTYSWIPFGGGLRRCIGASLATQEARVVLRTLIQERDIHPAAGADEATKRAGVVMVPARGARVLVTAA